MTTLPAPPLGELSAQLSQQRRQFLAAVAEIRPQLHRYCAKMTGSVLDGEDVVQETLATAFYRLHTLQDPAKLSSWLFRIAHNRAIDHIRSKRREPVGLDELPEESAPEEVDPVEIEEALTRVVTHLPPKERACVVLKDVLGYPLTDIADIVDSTVGGVKAALHRGRGKLAKAEPPEPNAAPLNTHEQALIAAYLARFSAQDWEGVRSLLGADARLEVVDFATLRGREAISGGYFTNYQRIPWQWELRPSLVDGVPMAVHWRKHSDGTWRPHAPLEITATADEVLSVRDFVHVEYLLENAHVEALDSNTTKE